MRIAHARQLNDAHSFYAADRSTGIGRHSHDGFSEHEGVRASKAEPHGSVLAPQGGAIGRVIDRNVDVFVPGGA